MHLPYEEASCTCHMRKPTATPAILRSPYPDPSLSPRTINPHPERREELIVAYAPVIVRRQAVSELRELLLCQRLTCHIPQA